MIKNKIFNLHDALISNGFEKEAFEIIKLAAQDIADDLLSEARLNMGVSGASNWRTIVSKTKSISVGEIKSTLLSLGADFIKPSGQNTDHDKYRAESIIVVADSLKNKSKSSMIPSEAAEYFNQTFSQCSERTFFTVQRAANSYVPATSFTSSFWKFVKCLAAAKIISELYLTSNVSIKSPSESQSDDYKTMLFGLLLERKDRIERDADNAYQESDNERLMALIDEKEAIESEINSFWRTI